MLAIPVPYRFLILGIFIITMLLWDLRHPPSQRYRWQEYPFILGVGCVGAIVGVGNDLITSWLSPEYFLYFKGLPAELFLWNVILLGSQAGFAAGAVGSGILLLGRPVSQNRTHRIATLVPWVKWPFVSAIATGTLFGLFSHHLHWPQSFGDLDGLLEPNQAHWFHTVWMIHIGLYAGAVVSLCVISIHLRYRVSRHLSDPP
ncbi:MAG: hypothetical protein F6K09_24770 [Merismopedia sp. SIO2A8]|nr:hypothetical protein [Symploca sp. SIO2B6]NET51793.1 hypothetical protein [Merismopedia sp. SIO2A8]